MAKVKPTRSTPYVVQDDGTCTLLVDAGRTLLFTITHPTLADPTGYTARVGFKAEYEAADTDDKVLVSAEADSILADGDGGSVVTFVVPDESMEALQDYAGGKVDVVLESPGGQETTLLTGTFVVQKRVVT